VELTTERLWQDFKNALYGYILKNVGDSDEAQDILQDVFVKIHTHLHTLQDEERVSSWVYQIARNTIIDHQRQRKNHFNVDEIQLQSDLEPEPDASLELASGLGYYIDNLPEPYRTAVVMTELEGKKQTELSREWGISESGAKSRVQRGRQMIKDALLECCHFEFDLRGNVMAYASRPEYCSLCDC
jgi:RNA polymerase sigma-70 factor, ECF subfamily